ncbi:MAG: Asp23/Gls24 family envelope stress response protein [Eubacterium sp.]|nr:Asp23/Gls24 family envelope stress response protein [Eubacterium sp.]
MSDILKSTENENGRIVIEKDVIAQYAGYAALDCFGIVGMATISMKDGLAKLLKGDNVGRGVSVRIDEDNTLNIDFHIIVAYGVNIKTVVNNLVSTVKYQIEDYTNMKVKGIKVYVEGVRVID